jgi:hypothetical protein
VPPLTKNPVFLYFRDRFQRPNPFRPDIAIDITESLAKKVDGLDAHVSQFYEWLPWTNGDLANVPKDVTERKKWLLTSMERRSSVTPENQGITGQMVRHGEGRKSEICRSFRNNRVRQAAECRGGQEAISDAAKNEF